MAAAKKMIQILKGKEQAIKWGIARNDKKDKVKVLKISQRDKIQYYEVMRRQFLDFISQQTGEDQQLKSIWVKEKVIEMRLVRLRQIAEERLDLIERFRNSLDNARWASHLKEEEILIQQVLREEYIERL